MQSALMESSNSMLFVGMALGRVYRTYPDAKMVDIMLWDGTLVPKVQVMSPYASSNYGILSMPIPKYKDGSMLDREIPYRDAEVTENDVWAVVGFFEGSLMTPIVLGFLFPEENEMLCSTTDEKDTENTTAGNEKGGMYLWKHISNVYTRVAENGEIEINHPSGLLIKIGGYDGSKGADEQRTEINNFDKKIRPFRYLDPETGKAADSPTMHIYHPAGTYITIDTAGSVTIYVEKDVATTIKGDVTESIDGDVTRTIKGNLTETIEGDVSRTVQGGATEKVTDAWNRESEASIDDKAPEISHTGA